MLTWHTNYLENKNTALHFKKVADPCCTLYRPIVYVQVASYTSCIFWVVPPGSRGLPPELLPVHPVGSAVLLPGGVPSESVRSLRLWLRDP